MEGWRRAGGMGRCHSVSAQVPGDDERCLKLVQHYEESDCVDLNQGYT